MMKTIKSILLFIDKIIDIIKLLLSIINKLLLFFFILFIISIYDKIKLFFIKLYNIIPFIEKVDIDNSKSIIRTMISSLFTFLLFTNISLANNVFNKTSNFILQNENQGNMSLKAYNNDGNNTICDGLTYYIVEKKMNKKHKCKLIDKNNKNKGWYCKVNKNDILTLKECKKQSKAHFLHREQILVKLLTGKRTGINWYNLLTNNEKVVVHDIIHNHGSSNKQVKKVMNSIMEFKYKKTTKNTIQLITDIYNLTYTKHLIFSNGIRNRNDARVSMFFNKN